MTHENDTCGGKMTATELLIHAMDQVSKSPIDRVVVLMLHEDGFTMEKHGNERSYPEGRGILELALELFYPRETVKEKDE
jgi:hypothetical protein